MDQKLLKDTILGLEKMCDLFYQDKIQVAYGELNSLLMNLEKVISMFAEEEQEHIKDKLMEALDALEQQDFTLYADIMNYEIKELLGNYAE